MMTFMMFLVFLMAADTLSSSSSSTAAEYLTVSSCNSLTLLYCSL